jgi:hypothetical protein
MIENGKPSSKAPRKEHPAAGLTGAPL